EKDRLDETRLLTPRPAEQTLVSWRYHEFFSLIHVSEFAERHIELVGPNIGAPRVDLTIDRQPLEVGDFWFLHGVVLRHRQLAFIMPSRAPQQPRGSLSSIGSGLRVD